MDGTIADFYGSALALHGVPNLYDNLDNLGVYRAQEILQMTNREFWGPADDQKKFWPGLAKTVEADQIVDTAKALFGEKNCAILTAPSLNPACVPGKREWVRRNYPELADRIIFTHNKEFLAGDGNVLFDDSDDMIEKFIVAGGIGVKVPRAWNNLH